jgi:rhodanese-related sulfurtransferase
MNHRGRGTWVKRLTAVVILAAMAAPGVISPARIAMAAEQTAPYTTITSTELAAMLQTKNFSFINVHIPYEGEIARTDAFIPFDEIADNLDQLPSDRSAAIVLYCRSGRMSEIAANELAAMGYSNVSHLAGGMNAWEQAGNEVVRK